MSKSFFMSFSGDRKTHAFGDLGWSGKNELLGIKIGANFLFLIELYVE